MSADQYRWDSKGGWGLLYLKTDRTPDQVFADLKIGTIWAQANPHFPWMFASWVEEQTPEQKAEGVVCVEFRPMEHCMGQAALEEK